MILKGNQRGGGQQLAAHLLNSFDNERVEVADVRGTVAQDLSGFFGEIAAHARGTKCRKFIYSLSVNPDQHQGHWTREQYLDLLERTERSLKLVGQPRAVVFHEKRDKDGVLREHCHVAWSRIDTGGMKAVQIAHDRLKLRSVARDFARDHGLQLPDGMNAGRNNKKFNDRARQENLGERQQQERTGVTKAEHMATLAFCWNNTSNGAAFVKAMEDKGYILARGDDRAYVVIDLYGEIHSLSRYLIGAAKSKEMYERLSGHPKESLPGVEAARATAAKNLQEKQKVQDSGKQEAMGGRQADGGELSKKRDALKERQQTRRAGLDKMRLDLHARQFAERGALRGLQDAEKSDVAVARLDKEPKGLRAFLTRVTGIGKIVTWAQNMTDRRRDAVHRQETVALGHRHGRELKEMDRHYVALDRLEARENRAASMAVNRENHRPLRRRSFQLKTEFDKALKAQDVAASGGGSGLLGRLAARFTKGDLQAAFERATSARTRPSGDTDTRGPAVVDPEKLDRASSLKEELERLQREQDRDKRGPDRGR